MGWIVYLNNFWNWVDVGNLVLFCIYFIATWILMYKRRNTDRVADPPACELSEGKEYFVIPHQATEHCYPELDP